MRREGCFTEGNAEGNTDVSALHKHKYKHNMHDGTTESGYFDCLLLKNSNTHTHFLSCHSGYEYELKCDRTNN